MSEIAFHFLRPWWFLACIPVLIVLWRMTKAKKEQKVWANIIDPELLPHVLTNETVERKSWPIYLTGIAGLISILSLAGPVWEQLPQPVFRSDSALVIAVDLSRSMDATDLKPSRIIKARFKIADLLASRKEGQTALIAFAGRAFTVTPLTDDTATITSQLKALSTHLMPEQGSRADRAMINASELLKQAGYLEGDILLITDGIKLERDRLIASQLKKVGYRVSILGIGTKTGAPIPDHRGGFFTDKKGEIVVPKLDKASLKALAKAGGGSYQTYNKDGWDIEQIVGQLETSKTKTNRSETDLKTDQWREEGPWILLAMIPFVLLVFRKGYLSVLIFIGVGLSSTPDVMANDFWQRADQKAQALLESGEATEAADVFHDPAWKGSAQYKAGDYEGALQTWKEDESIKALYNKATALAKLGKLEEAKKGFEELLKQQADHEDAVHNLNQVEQALKKRDEQKNDKNDKNNDESKVQKQDSQDKKNDQSPDDKNQDQDSKNDQENEQQDKQNQSDSEQNQQDSQPENSKNDQQPSDGKDKSSEDEKDAKSKDDADKADKRDEEPKHENQQTLSEEEQKAKDEQEKEAASKRAEDALSKEEEQAVEAALRSITDDPGGLLRRKFKYQYQQQATQADSEEQQW